VPAGGTPGTAPYRQYLVDSETQIRARTVYLAADAAAHRPAWTTALGDPPTDTDRHAQWLRQLGVVAAYRDQHGVADDDPRHPLGPFIEAGRAGHQAYWQAAQALVQRREERATSPVEPGREADHRLAIDTYVALSAADRHAVATTIVGRLGVLWPGTNPDEALTHSVYAADLHRALCDHHHLAEPAGPTLAPAEPQRAQRNPQRSKSARDNLHRRTTRGTTTRQQDNGVRRQATGAQPRRVQLPPEPPTRHDRSPAPDTASVLSQ
jgi:hypothetical protein